MSNAGQNARVRRPTRNPIIKLLRKINDWVNNNPESSQFWGSIISSVITLLALFITVIFSWKALSESQKQNINANKQLELATQQFNSSQIQHKIDSIEAANKDTIANNRFIKDTIKQGQQERAQERRNQLQDAANKQQFELNKSQLKAVQVQAQIAKDQFTQQQLQYKQQVYEQRPVFTIDSVNLDKINSKKSAIKFSFSNTGIRPAHVDSLAFAYYNPKTLDFNAILSKTNLDLLLQKGSITTSKLPIYDDCISNGLTVYYLLIYYKDLFNRSSKIESIFFNYTLIQPHQLAWNRAQGFAKDDFIKLLKKKKFLVIE